MIFARCVLPVIVGVAAACGGAPARPATSGSTATSTPTSTATATATPTDSFLRAYALTRGFKLGMPLHMTPTPDGRAVLFLRSGPRDPKQSLFETDLATGATRELLSPSAVVGNAETLSPAERARRERMRVTTTGFTSFELSDDGARVLVTLSGRVFVLTRATGKVRELPTGGAPGAEDASVIDPHLSRDGTRVAYVRGHDVYAIGVDAGAEVAVTRGGTEAVSHGVAEFAAQEELDRSRGFWWSPDGARIAYEEADTTNVEHLAILDLAHPERAPDVSAYPRAGKANALVRFGIVSSNGGGATTWIALGRERYPYVATVSWQRGAPLTLYALDRLQKNAVLFAVDAATGKAEPLLAEHDDAWIDVDASAPRWLVDGSAFVWSSERAGAWRPELRDKAGALVRALASSELGYRELYAVDDARKVAYVAASSEPATASLFRVPLDGGAATPLVTSDGSVVSAFFGEGHDVFATSIASLAGMPRFAARTVDGASHEIPSVAEAPQFTPRVELTKVGPDDTRVAIVRPTSFAPGKRYAIIDAAYGGPGHAVVAASAHRYLLQQWLADRTGAIVVAIDARGTPNRGRAWERALAGKLGAVPVEGHVAAIAALAARYPEMDASRVGVYGWSFGGYFAALAVLTRPDVYKVAVAGAPVAEWRDYDTCYTERYLGLPEASAADYDAASLLTHARAPLSEHPPRPLLVIHGTADDNVYFTNTLKLVDALESARRPFELVPLVGVTHLPHEPEKSEILWTKVSDFLAEHLR